MGNPIRVVRVACSGEVSVRHVKEGFDSQNAHELHPVFTQGQLSPVSELMGVPLLLMKVRPSLLRPKDSGEAPLQYGTEMVGEYYSNSLATRLMMRCYESADGKKSIAPLPDWKDSIGMVLVARTDRKILHPTHVKLMAAFLDLIFHEEYGPRDEEDMKKRLKPVNFQNFYWATLVSFQGDPKTRNFRNALAKVGPPFPQGSLGSDEKIEQTNVKDKQDEFSLDPEFWSDPNLPKGSPSYKDSPQERSID
ncbi:uncharacterized protein RHO25_008426 [Cercospora beticola]|uniref:Uncharacterized protein n=1 Tax=Cercospora beticola TaxID=122368 RepID=A0ABZ0NWE8_CERBT|nr:hypothetical protein RHO25_008426 [Cercospora beticola]CAK1357451.1 unnamed protein product [Cercospora beticola]